ncbi:PPR domain-containing protein/PPR_3 domain-containing protein [Cephalotus follicularis]|uniref:PPR domain-containing protein/PPR_3 domain-containing protein n=1 Tax=Cephalotus follicularis TaxID=3775 RepID=A0A1Q3CY67_CEPFO|nr:PPR domain-containing protein/PPR_3 domain-containing protein [Cephalotus follicularis]
MALGCRVLSVVEKGFKSQRLFCICSKPSTPNPLLIKLLQVPTSRVKATLDSEDTFALDTSDFSWDALVTASLEKARLVIEWRLGKMLNEKERDYGQYSNLISVCGKIQNIPLAMQVFTSMEAQGIKPTSFIFNSLVSVCLSTGNTATAVSLFEVMERSESYKPNAETYDNFILAFANMRNAYNLHVWYSAKKAAGFSSSLQTFESLISVTVKLRDFDSADRIYKEMLSSGVRPNTLILETLLEGFCMKKSLYDVKEFLNCILDDGWEITVNMVEKAVGFYLEFRYVEEMEELLVTLSKSKQVTEVLVRIHCGIISLYAMLDRLDDVEYSMKRMMEQGMSFKCPDDVEKVICLYFRQAAYDSLELFLEHIKASYYELTRSNYDLLVAGYRRAGLSQRVDSVINEMKSVGFS